MEVVQVIITLPFLILYLAAIYRIIKKAGFNGWWTLTALVPILNFIMLIVFAFKPWPAVDVAVAENTGQPGRRSDFQQPPAPAD
jgi:uncharacterized membrane protein YhaH (DUF805 family)